MHYCNVEIAGQEYKVGFFAHPGERPTRDCPGEEAWIELDNIQHISKKKTYSCDRFPENLVEYILEQCWEYLGNLESDIGFDDYEPDYALEWGGRNYP